MSDSNQDSGDVEVDRRENNREGIIGDTSPIYDSINENDHNNDLNSTRSHQSNENSEDPVKFDFNFHIKIMIKY